jgi:hypothetical protein
MKALCPACHQPLPPVDLPVCPRCGQRLAPAAAAPPPAEPNDSPAQRAARLLPKALVFAPPLSEYVALVLAPWLLPPAVYGLSLGPNGGAMAGWGWVTPAAIVLALVLSVTLAVTRAPARRTVRLERVGIRHRGRLAPWDRVRGAAVLAQGPRGRQTTLVLTFDDGAILTIGRGLQSAGAVASPANVAQLVRAIAGVDTSPPPG